MDLKASWMTKDRDHAELIKEISGLLSSHDKLDRESKISALIECAVKLASQKQDINEIDLVNDLIDETLNLFYTTRDVQKYKQKTTLRSAAIL